MGGADGTDGRQRGLREVRVAIVIEGLRVFHHANAAGR